MNSPWFSWRENRLSLNIRVQTRRTNNAIEGLQGGRLRTKLDAPPLDGAANRALETLLSDEFAVTTSHVTIAKGHKSRDKLVRRNTPEDLPQWFSGLGGVADPG